MTSGPPLLLCCSHHTVAQATITQPSAKHSNAICCHLVQAQAQELLAQLPADMRHVVAVAPHLLMPLWSFWAPPQRELQRGHAKHSEEDPDMIQTASISVGLSNVEAGILQLAADNMREFLRLAGDAAPQCLQDNALQSIEALQHAHDERDVAVTWGFFLRPQPPHTRQKYEHMAPKLPNLPCFEAFRRVLEGF